MSDNPTGGWVVISDDDISAQVHPAGDRAALCIDGIGTIAQMEAIIERAKVIFAENKLERRGP